MTSHRLYRLSKYYITALFLKSIHLLVCTHACIIMCSQRPVHHPQESVSPLLPSCGSQGIELGSSALPVSVFTQRAVSSAPWYHSWLRLDGQGLVRDLSSDASGESLLWLTGWAADTQTWESNGLGPIPCTISVTLEESPPPLSLLPLLQNRVDFTGLEITGA